MNEYKFTFDASIDIESSSEYITEENCGGYAFELNVKKIGVDSAFRSITNFLDIMTCTLTSIE